MIRSSVRPWLLTCASLAALAAQDDPQDLRLALTILPTPEVSERITTSGGQQQTYDWNEGGLYDRRGGRAELQWRHRLGEDGLPQRINLILGANAGYCDITPKGYTDSNGATTGNARQDLSLGYNQIGGAVGLGLTSQPTAVELGWLHWEAAGIFRGGEGWAQTISSGANPAVSTARGHWFEGAVQGAMVVVNDGWLFDLHLGVDLGTYRARTYLDDGSLSELVIGGVRPEIGIAIGGTF